MRPAGRGTSCLVPSRLVTGLLVAGLLIASVLSAPSAAADNGARIDFVSRTPDGPSELMAGGGRATPLVGWLSVPEGGPAPRPAMIISHGSGGILDGREHAWARRLNALGVATFVVDSFSPRGIGATGEDQARLPLAASVADAFAALAWLAGRSDIDPTRIGIMGFSKGGQVALYTTLEPFRRGGQGRDLRFALHVALYPSCSIPYRSRAVTGAPMVLLLGGADDYTPAAHCARYIEYFRALGAPVVTEIFPGAHHGFDLPTPPRQMVRVQTARDCGLDIELEPVLGRRWDGGGDVAAPDIPGYLRGCMRRGATFGGNADALTGAIRRVSEAVIRHLRRD